MSGRDRALGAACVLVTALGWGLNWVVLKLVAAQMPPLLARGLTGLLGGLLLAVLVACAGGAVRVPRRALPRLLGLGLLNVSAWMGCASVGVGLLPVSVAVVLAYTLPLWTTLMRPGAFGRRRRGRTAIVACCSVLAVALVLSGASRLPAEPQLLAGLLVSLAGAVLFALGARLSERAVPGVTAAASVVWQLVLGSTVLLLLSAAVESPRGVAPVAGLWWLLGYMAVIPMCVCYLAWFGAVQRLGAEPAAIGLLLTPVFGVGFGTALLGGGADWRVLASVALIAASALAARPSRTAPEPVAS